MNQAAHENTVDRVDIEAVNKKENRALYKKRVKIHPKRVQGTYRALKWWIMLGTLGIYYVTPWIRWDRGPGVPDQAVLVDIPGSRLYFFFIEIWPQEIYYLAGLLIMAAIGLFFVTSLVGRAWCGYACPQTVWTDLFIAVERWIEGDRGARIRLDKAPVSASKISNRALKFAIWLLISVGTGGAWVFYFADAPTLAVDLLTFRASVTAYSTIAILAFTTFSLGGFMREQVCTYMCPWPRIQAAMMDEESATVTYRADRGETRGPYRKGESWESRGDCVDCNQCVAACPMGIDIRDGQQLECITCALCIDACDAVMAKVGRPQNLIAYASIGGETRRLSGDISSIKMFRWRTLFYLAAWCLVGGIMLYTLINRADLDINVLRDRNPLFVALSDGSIRNGYTFKILNKAREQRTLVLSIEGLAGARLKVVGSEDIAESVTPYFTVKPDRLHSFRLLVSAPRDVLATDSQNIRFVLSEINTRVRAHYDSIFRGPGQ
ncbi:MAG: cytochrome c oxidase accessory protein CcoG [Rhodospirillaceae bacterium]|nr:cytochrome c oxidase accessory protein CcoG [Rhodospirillaceae bacterium]MBT5297045.1 cytochrome c oxidase accessory protein CcoG [Rhodospirillaceae bacterium]MBT6609492.1 cytochrome c oxidase accessory protein CcoG [Rhodospirillaceae bacterium]MBT6885600.1 cytochrome c oxidase accessory protein CcoG [Rhodospirillaceae bacterium]MBT7249126.1 cytochrome c oxidase accessory protein CcoG [Rhodospirillaceae bacterium]